GCTFDHDPVDVFGQPPVEGHHGFGDRGGRVHQHLDLLAVVLRQSHTVEVRLPACLFPVTAQRWAHGRAGGDPAERTSPVEGFFPRVASGKKCVQSHRGVRQPQDVSVPAYPGPWGKCRKYALFPFGQRIHTDPLPQGKCLQQLVDPQTCTERPATRTEVTLCFDEAIHRRGRAASHTQVHGSCIHGGAEPSKKVRLRFHPTDPGRKTHSSCVFFRPLWKVLKSPLQSGVCLRRTSTRSLGRTRGGAAHRPSVRREVDPLAAGGGEILTGSSRGFRGCKES